MVGIIKKMKNRQKSSENPNKFPLRKSSLNDLEKDLYRDLIKDMEDFIKGKKDIDKNTFMSMWKILKWHGKVEINGSLEK